MRENKEGVAHSQLAAEAVESPTVRSMNADDTRQKLAKALAENARLRTDNDDLRRQISGLTGSRVWRMVNMLHRGLRWSIAWRGRVLRVISNPFRRVRNLMRFGAAEADAELLETCMVPTWSAPRKPLDLALGQVSVPQASTQPHADQ